MNLESLVLNEAFDEWEFPKRKWVEGWNVGTPVFQGSYDFFEKWGEQDLADMVRRERNHLSVFAWSIGNEVDYPNDPYSHPIRRNGERLSMDAWPIWNYEDGQQIRVVSYTNAAKARLLLKRVFHRRILAYVQSTDKAGEITVQFTSPWLKPAEITIKN